MLAAEITKAELARKMDASRQQVDPLLDICHPYRIKRIECALRILGKRSVEIFEAA